jgi:CubicO group peptidase (beta-lactamase class C family)
MKKKLLSIPLFFISFSVFSQIVKDSELYKTIMSKDSILFNVGFNTCDIKQFETLTSEKFEFYHDIAGISDKKNFVNGFINGICANPKQFQARRELITKSNTLYVLKTNGKIYGVIQEGIHQFFEKQADKPETFGSSARFTHLWLLEGDEWKLSKSYSYEHGSRQLSNDKTPNFNDKKEVENWLLENKIPTLGLGIIENGKLKQVQVYGDTKSGISVPINTIFNVASLTKPVTSIITLKLISQNKWSLDEPLSKYWIDPEIANDPRTKKLTTRLVLSHQTGFSNWRWNNPDKKLRFNFEPGTQHEYSGEGFEYLRKALENKFKKSLQELADELIFKPLKMVDSQFIWNNNLDTNRLALGYNSDGKTYPIIKLTKPNAADDLMTTIEDYGKFLTSVMSQEGLNKQVFEEMIKSQVSTKKGKFFGLGFEKYDLGNGNIALSHGGSDQGVQTLFFIFPKTKNGIIIFTNVDDGYKTYVPLIQHYLGEEGQKIIDIETKK